MRLGKGLKFLAAAPLAALVLAGCGGGGGSSASPATQVFAQDATNPNFAHLWVTLDKVTLSNGSSSTVVFDDTSSGGRVVDLRSLWNDQSNQPQFLLLGQTQAGTFTTVSVTLEPTASVVTTGSSGSVSANFGGSSGPVTFSSSVSGSSGNQVVIDFDLSKWTLNGSSLNAPNGQFIGVPIKTGVGNAGQHVAFQFFGQISGLSGAAPDQTFTLSDGTHVIGTVETSQNTSVYNVNGSPSPVLSNGEQVGVSGKFDPSSNAIVATSVAVFPTATAVTTPHLTGVVTADDATAGTLTVQNAIVGGFLPPSMTTNVTTSTSTTYYDANGVSQTEAQFFAAITVNTTQVVAIGTESNGTFSATTLKLVGSGALTSEAAFIGKPSNVDALAGTFDLTVQEWQGLLLRSPASTVIHVTTSSTTSFTAGTSKSAATFFADLTSTSSVFVDGTLDASTGTLAASKVAIGSSFMGSGQGGGTGG